MMLKKLFCVCFITALLTNPAISEESNRIVFDFEDGDLQGWEVVEGGFDKLLNDIEFFHNQPTVRYNKQGQYYLNTLEKSDGSRTDQMTGVLESPVFILQGPTVSFLIGGGNHPDTYLALCALQGNELKRAHGKNTEVMQRIEWDVQSLNGKPCFLRIVDKHRGGWGHVTFDDFCAQGYINPLLTEERFEKRKRAIREKKLKAETSILKQTLQSTRQAVSDLISTFGERYPQGETYLQTLKQLERKIAEIAFEDLDNIKGVLYRCQRDALMNNPLLSDQPILYVARPQYLPDHHSTATLFQNGEINTGSFRGGSALRLFDPSNGSVKTLIDCPEGIVRDPEVHYDGGRIILSLRHHQDDDYHIYEYHLQDQKLNQLTEGANLSDFDPAYLPNGDIVFVSTRDKKYCQCNRHIMGNLFTMEEDETNIQQIGRNTLFEGHPCLLPDGRILYDRWEYVDKHFGPAFGLWTVNPDGTNHAIYYGNNAWSPGAILDARPIPNTEFVVATLGSCHDRPWGAIAIIDRRKGLDGVSPIIHSWPDNIEAYLSNNQDYGKGEARHHPVGGQIDNFKRLSNKYEDPFPLSNNYFLCSRTIEGERTGLFLIDVFGNEICILEEEQGCYDPIPLKSHPRPPVIPSHVDLSKKEGAFYVADVYQGTGMDVVPKGAVKTLRVVEAPKKLFWTHSNWNLDATQAPAINFNCTNNKRILGDVPVESDGSAYFQVPADTFLFFQLLDENGMMIQSMRSGTMVRPGETLSCVGCHEDRLTTVQKQRPSLALRRPASKLQPWYGQPRDFNYLTEVQPVFDRYCVSCHDYGKPAGKKLNLSGDLGLVFNTSYLELRTKSALRWYPDQNADEKLLVKAVDDGPPEVLPAYAWGSHRSRLVEVIRNGHQDIKLDRESIDRVITWIDMNAPYYGSYASVYPDNVFGRSPLNNDQINQLRQLTGIKVGDISTELQGSQCNFTRPELSPCLQPLKQTSPDQYQAALAIIEAGKAMLEQRPRMDIPGAQMSEEDQEIWAKYESRTE